MRSDNWMPLYVSDYLRDTMHLSTELHGAYMLLLMACWSRGGELPADDVQLAGVTRMSASAWKRAKPVLGAFFQITTSSWTHKRVSAELRRAQDLTEKRRNAGAKGGRPRSQNESKPKPKGFANGNQTGEQNETPAGVARPSSSLRSEETTDSSDAIASARSATPQEKALALELRSLLPTRGHQDDSEPDPDAQAWSLAVVVLTKQGGLSEKQARAFFGATLKRTGLRGADLLVPLIQAEDAGTLDPQGYITQAAQNVRSPHVRRTSNSVERSTAYTERLQDIGGAMDAAFRGGAGDVRDRGDRPRPALTGGGAGHLADA